MSAGAELQGLRHSLPHERPVQRAGICPASAAASRTASSAARASLTAQRSRTCWPISASSTTARTTCGCSASSTIPPRGIGAQDAGNGRAAWRPAAGVPLYAVVSRPRDSYPSAGEARLAKLHGLRGHHRGLRGAAAGRCRCRISMTRSSTRTGYAAMLEEKNDVESRTRAGERPRAEIQHPKLPGKHRMTPTLSGLSGGDRPLYGPGAATTADADCRRHDDDARGQGSGIPERVPCRRGGGTVPRRCRCHRRAGGDGGGAAAVLCRHDPGQGIA